MGIFDRFDLTGKRLFITGGSRGLGREMALAIADAGADVILVGRDPFLLPPSSPLSFYRVCHPVACLNADLRVERGCRHPRPPSEPC
jgi:NAD(P)-dependent dehydrogenase (short-subunit alcohol dehydrogenase family)